MKKWIALLLTLVMTLSFAACGAGNNNPNDPAGKDVVGETYDAGNLTVFVPENWKQFAVMDIWSEDADAVDPDKLNLVKNGQSEWDLLTKPSIQVLHYAPGSMLTPSKDFYEGAVDIAPITAGDLTWEGFSAEDFLGNPMTILWTTNADGHQFQLNIYSETSEDKFELTDADVLAILKSVTNS